MSSTAKRRKRLLVTMSDAEHAAIKDTAASAGLSMSALLRQLGLGHEPASVLDHHSIRDLMRVCGDQGRLGGLLKLWLVERPGEGASVQEVRDLLHRLEAVTATIEKKAGLL